MALIVHTRNLMISCFKSTHRRTIHRKRSNSHQIPSLKDCRKVLLTKKFLIQRKSNTNMRLKSQVNVNLKYSNNKSEKWKTRKRNIIWFNPPFSNSVSTNVAKKFLQLVKKHFPRSHNLHKIFNRDNTVKVSDSCMNNMSKIIKGHNKKVTSKPRDQRPRCNCRKKAECPMEGNCLVKDVFINVT